MDEWDELLRNVVLPSATVVRLLHQAHIIDIRRQRYSLKKKVGAGMY
ncbi:ATP-binding protein [Alicyclobacillus sp. SO9]